MESHDQEYLNKLRHSTAHLLAAAVMELWPSTKPTIGPPIQDGFYYDFDFETPISESNLKTIEKKMREILKSWESFISEMVTVDAVANRTPVKNNEYKQELVNEIVSKGEPI